MVSKIPYMIHWLYLHITDVNGDFTYFWQLLFSSKNNKFCFILIEFQLVDYHPFLNFRYAHYTNMCIFNQD